MKLSTRAQGLVWCGLVLFIWIGTALPAILLGPPPADMPAKMYYGYSEFGFLLEGRVLGTAALLIWTGAMGAKAFAAERGSGAMEQLVLTPLPRKEIVAERLLPIAKSLAPALCTGCAVDFLLVPLAANAARQASTAMLVTLAATFAVSITSAAALCLCLSFMTSLRARTTTRAVVWTAALFFQIALLEAGLFISADYLASWTGRLWAILPVYMAAAVLRAACAVWILSSCVTHFDRMALGSRT